MLAMVVKSAQRDLQCMLVDAYGFPYTAMIRGEIARKFLICSFIAVQTDMQCQRDTVPVYAPSQNGKILVTYS